MGYSDKNSNFTGDDGDLYLLRLKEISSTARTHSTSLTFIITDHALNILSDSYNGSIQIYSPRINLSSTSINFGDVSILGDY